MYTYGQLGVEKRCHMVLPGPEGLNAIAQGASFYRENFAFRSPCTACATTSLCMRGALARACVSRPLNEFIEPQRARMLGIWLGNLRQKFHTGFVMWLCLSFSLALLYWFTRSVHCLDKRYREFQPVPLSSSTLVAGSLILRSLSHRAVISRETEDEKARPNAVCTRQTRTHQIS